MLGSEVLHIESKFLEEKIPIWLLEALYFPLTTPPFLAEDFISHLNKIYLSGRIILFYFCWNQHVTACDLVFADSVSPVQSFLTALLKPGLPSTT